jgi:ParB family transcriptional regulator, chromosome partitioning protein
MTAKAKMKRTNGVAAAPDATGNKTPNAAAHQPDYKLIRQTDLQPSPTNPRRRIDESTIASLAESITAQGVLEPLIVRSNGEGGYEIVCGERRYRAAEVAKISELPCLVRELTDEQVLDIQIHENLHREDVHPMDEACGYQFLKEKLGCDVKELALRVGKPEGYVLNRLKLNLLIEEAQKDIDDGHLPLSYALEIAKYAPDIQRLIYAEVYRKEGKFQTGKYVQVPVKGETVPWKWLAGWINANVHRLLSKAPFNPKANNLREDGLACVNCPERTGAVVGLFEPNQVGRKDSCLNPACFATKANNHIQIRRRELAERARIEPAEVPLVRSFCYSDGDGYLGSESAKVIPVGDTAAKRGAAGKGGKMCKLAVSAVDIEPDNYGRTVQVCLRCTQCKLHWPDPKVAMGGNPPKGKSPEAEAAGGLEAHRARREEIWNAKVAEAVRVRVFEKAAEKFGGRFNMAEVGTDLLPQLVARFWRMTASADSNNLNGVVKPLVARWGAESTDSTLAPSLSGGTSIDQIKGMPRGMQFRLLFVLVHCQKGAIGFGNNYRPQNEVRELAAEFEVDYALVDAEVRLKLSPKKHKQAHQIYLDDVRGKLKEHAKVPRLFSEKWKAPDWPELPQASAGSVARSEPTPTPNQKQNQKTQTKTKTTSGGRLR